jgi:hypothetical protein
MVSMTFNRDGTRSRNSSTPCEQCGSKTICNDCWDHVRDWSPFGIIPCACCDVPQFVYHPHGAGCGPFRCDVCGYDETPVIIVDEDAP